RPAPPRVSPRRRRVASRSVNPTPPHPPAPLKGFASPGRNLYVRRAAKRGDGGQAGPRLDPRRGEGPHRDPRARGELQEPPEGGGDVRPPPREKPRDDLREGLHPHAGLVRGRDVPARRPRREPEPAGHP